MEFTIIPKPEHITYTAVIPLDFVPKVYEHKLALGGVGSQFGV
jgi:hypothetical protein